MDTQKVLAFPDRPSLRRVDLYRGIRPILTNKQEISNNASVHETDMCCFVFHHAS